MSNDALLLLLLLFGTMIVIHILTVQNIRRTRRQKYAKGEDLSRKLAELYKKAYPQGLKKKDNIKKDEDKTNRLCDTGKYPEQET